MAQLVFPPNSVVIPNSGLTLYWQHDADSQTLEFGLESNRIVNYFGVGFAPSGSFGMDNFDIVAFVFTPDNSTGAYTTTVLDNFASQVGPPPTDVSQGGTDDYVLTDSYVGTSTCQVLFHRAYNTNDKYDFTFDGDVEVNKGIAVSWAWQYNGVYGLSFHQNNAGTIVVRLADSGAIILDEF